MKRPLLLAALLVLPVTAIAQDQAPPAPAQPAQPVQMAPPTTPDEFVTQRQARMARGGGNLASQKQVLDANGDLTTLTPRIERLIEWAQALPTMFPEGSDTAASGAKPEVWSDHAGFQAAADRFRTAVQALAAPAAANDHAAFLTAWTAAHDACSGCHTAYKQ
jgi:cytochrome c556